ncbi:MAG TPA: hypothetical protein VFQ25_12390, partial [Ktedonobacterales bacterium]|nr:hypothetical protein [Ktedonobacterales bacterium]
MTGGGLFSIPHMAGALLILGAILIGVGASVATMAKDKGGPVIWGQPPREWLRLIFEHQDAWRWGAILWIAGMVVTLLGLPLLTDLLRSAGDPGFAQAGLLAFTVSIALWVISLSFRASVDIWAARTAAATHSVPESYAPLSAWSGALFIIFTIIAFVALALYGGAILASNLLPGWVGWASIIFA